MADWSFSDPTTWDWGSIAKTALPVLGTAYAANQASNAQQNVANANTAAAQQAAEAAAFRPVGVTTRFGKSGFQYDDQGRLVGAGYQVAPDVAAQREALMGLAGGSLSQAQAAQGFQAPLTSAAQGLFNLGQQYIAESPEAAAQRVMSQQQGLLAPGREQQLANIRNRLQQTGRSGLATGATTAGGMAATNPEMAAYYNAMAQQDAQLAANAQQQAQQQALYGAGLFGTGAGLIGQGYGLQTQALSPWTGYLGGAQTLEGLGQQALTTGSGLGSNIAQAGAQQGASLLKGGLYAADALQKGASIQSAATAGAINSLTNKLTDPIAALIGGLAKPTWQGTSLANTYYGTGGIAD